MLESVLEHLSRPVVPPALLLVDHVDQDLQLAFVCVVL